MRHSMQPRTAVCLLVLLAMTGVAAASCQGDGPEAVLRCFSDAYSGRDVDALEEVLAEDYVWLTVSPPEVDIFDRATSVAASVAMFGDEQVEYVALEFEDGYSIRKGAAEGTWRIEDLQATLTVKTTSEGTPRVAPLCVTFYIREVGADPPGYEVYREVFFEGNGCVGK